LEEADVLECPGDPHPDKTMRGDAGDIAILEPNPTASRWQEPGDDVEQRCLACAVRTDDRGDTACLDVDRHLIEGTETPERARDPVDSKK
jgi:hypothetical protein